MKILGIDEAGRGPVIGSLFVAGVKIEEKDEDRLANIGVRDSKLLSQKKREALFDQITGICEGYEIVEKTVQEIDSAVLSGNSNLNWLEAEIVAEIANKLGCDRLVLDCPSNNINAFTSYVRGRLDDEDIEIVAEHKADINHPVVSAASILAKVKREEHVLKLKKRYGDFGSGYPSDPKAVRFLELNHSRYDIFRKSWTSYRNAKEKSIQRKLVF
jgi:ribonuclease HII